MEPKRISDVEVLSAEKLGVGGYTYLNRVTARNIREDGTKSKDYVLDMFVRPRGTDAVVVLAYQRSASSGNKVEVLLRWCLRPSVQLARDGETTRDGRRPDIQMLEVVAGTLEREDQGLEGILKRAKLELEEEAGIQVEASSIQFLGGFGLTSPAAFAEQMYFCIVETDLRKRVRAEGDGSPLEEGGVLEIWTLEEALAACRNGTVHDLKTEVILRRFAEHLQAEE